jgi:hypothetical protein
MTRPVFADRLRTRAGVTMVLLAVALVAAAIYLPALGYESVWDDARLVEDNPAVTGPTPLDAFRHGFWPQGLEPLSDAQTAAYRPLTTLSFWVQHRLFGPGPFGGHLLNLLLHVAVSVLVTLVIWEMLHSGVWAALGGLLFAVHPAHVEAVAYVSARADLLVGLFTALAAVGLLRGLRKHSPWWWLLVPVGFGLGLLAKESALLFPLLCALAPLLTRTRYSRGYWLVVGSVTAVLAGYAALRSPAAPVHAAGLPLLNQLVDAANTLGLYLQMFFWPVRLRALFPPDPVYQNLTPAVITTVLFLVTIPLVALRRRFWVTLWGYAWTVLLLFPALHWLPLANQASDRVLYLASAGLVLIVVTLLSRLLAARARLRAAVGIALVGITLMLALVSVRRSRVWRDRASLAAAMTAEAPDSPIGYAQLADAVRPRLPDSAVVLYNRAIITDQDYLPAHLHVAALFRETGDWRRASHHLRIANELRPGSPLILTELGRAFLAAGMGDSAAAYALRALELDSGFAPALLLLDSLVKD